MLKAEYAYDAWGKCKIEFNDADNIANINPFRYRGYYYDLETGLYYLQSRYYDPETGRFINADAIAILDEAKEFINGLNLFAYCFNNPVMHTDETGDMPNWLKWLAIGAAILGAIIVIAAVTVLTAGVGTTVLAGTMAGAIIHGAAVGALIGAGVGVVAGGLIGGAVSGWSAEGIFAGMALGFGGGALIGAVIGGAVGGMSFASTANIHSIYVSKTANGSVNYVGRTSNIARRTAQHAANGRGIVPQQVAKNLSLKQARGLEQALINNFGLKKFGGQLINKVYGISASNLISFNMKWATKTAIKIISKFGLF